MNCFNCDKKAEHQHHVVPKSKGGKKTIPLCIECHSKAHNKYMTGSYLTKLGLMKRNAGYISYIFWNFFVMNYSIKSISIECEKSERWLKNQIKKMMQINQDDLIDIVAPILKPDESLFFTRQYLKQIITDIR